MLCWEWFWDWTLTQWNCYEWLAGSAMREKGRKWRICAVYLISCIFNILYFLWKIVSYLHRTPPKKVNITNLILKSTNSQSIKGQDYNKPCFRNLTSPFLFRNSPWSRRLGPQFPGSWVDCNPTWDNGTSLFWEFRIGIHKQQAMVVRCYHSDREAKNYSVRREMGKENL